MLAHLAQVSTLDSLGPDIRTAPWDDQGLYFREELAQHAVGLLQSGVNVLLRGESGVGKTALVRSFISAEWRRKDMPNGEQLNLIEARPMSAPLIIETNASAFIQGCQYCHDLENKMEYVLGAARKHPAILFIDPLDECIGAGASTADSFTDVAKALLIHLERGLRVIGTVTPGGEARMRARNPRLLERFTIVDVPEPDLFEAECIGRIKLDAYARKGATISDGALEAAMELSTRYLPGVPLVAGLTRLAGRAAGDERVVNPESLRRALVHETGLLPGYVGAADCPTYAEIARGLEAEVFGQPQAVSDVADSLVGLGVGFSQRGRPFASFLLAGPTGCGKTSLALACTRLLCKSDDALVRVDMSEYSDPFAVKRLIAAREGSLVTRLLSRSSGVLLLDEVEKASPYVWDLLLQVLGEARLTSEDGRTARLDNYLVMLTSNVGGRRWSQGMPAQKTVPLVLSDIAQQFSPEFRARLTRTLVFEPISRATGQRIVERELSRLNQLPGVVERGLQLVWAGTLPGALADVSVSVEKGARGVQSAVRTLVGSPLARWLADNPGARDGIVMLAPRISGSQIESLTIDWVDDSGFHRGVAN